MDSLTSWKHHSMSQSNKSTLMKDEAGNAALIPGSSAWGALKGGTSQKPLILSPDGNSFSGEKTSPKPSPGEKARTPSCPMMHINGIVNRWTISSSSSTNGAWVDNKDIASGWGTPNSSPLPNAGTEVWSVQKQSVEGGSSCWGSDNSSGSVWGGGDSKNGMETESKSVWAVTCSQPALWAAGGGDCKPVSLLSSTSSPWPDQEQSSKWDSAGPQTSTVISQSSTLGSWAQAAGRGLPATAGSKSANSAPGSNMSREELIARAINSQDGWGQMPVRQDTAWDVTVEPPVTSSACKMPFQTESSTQPGQHASNTGTAIWQASKDNPPELGPHMLLTSAAKESMMGSLPWVSSETNVGSGWEMPLPVEGSASALLSAEQRSLPSIKCGTSNGAWSALLDSKASGTSSTGAGTLSALNTWGVSHSSERVCEQATLPAMSVTQTGAGSSTADGAGAPQCRSLAAALLDSYERQLSSTSSSSSSSSAAAAAAAAVWDSSSVQHTDATVNATVNTSPTWGSQSVPLHGAATATVLEPEHRTDIWNQAGALKPAQWSSSKPVDSAIWSSASLVS